MPNRIAPQSKEPVEATPRRAMTKARKLRILEAHEFLCGDCGFPLGLERVEYDHVVQLWMGGADDDANVEPLHVDCHRKKTAADAARRAKVKRLTGETGSKPGKPISSRGFDKSRTRRFDGTVITRATQDGARNR